MKIGYIRLADPAMSQVRQEKLDREIGQIITKFFLEESQFVMAKVPIGDREALSAALIRMCDQEKCPLVLTFGGTGPALGDVAPDVTLEVVDRHLPGMGEIMRYYSYERFKVSVLSRAESGVRGRSLILNLPVRTLPVKFCLKLLQEGIAEALEQLSGSKPGLRGDEISLPIDKVFPFLKKIRPKPHPDGELHQSL